MTKNSQQMLSLLGLARRARQVKSGEGTVLQQVRTGQAKFVLLASDASAGTKKKFTDKCRTYEVPLNCQFSREQLSTAAGQNRSVFAICQAGFAHKFEELQQHE